MGLAQHIQIQMPKGYARITLNLRTLLITYYRHRQPIDYAVVSLQHETFIYRDGWDIKNLLKIVRACEPNKTNDKLKRTALYHE